MHKIKIRVISFLLTAFLVLGGFVIQSRQEAAFWRQQIQLGYSHAFTELSTAMDELNTALQKGRYASSPPLLATLCTQIYGKSMSAQMALGELPYANVELEQTAAFVATAGDYALALA
ncbi:MAG: germination protein YpeB, partial [Clostridiales bacterium]|nr:germination protein YpeB [Clostridiales bacterium]